MEKKNGAGTQSNLDAVEKSIAKKLSLQRVKELSGDSDWTLLEQVIQDIEAFYVVKNEKRPSLDKIIELVADEIHARYGSDTIENNEIRDVLLDSIPSRMTLNKWRNKKGWEEAVWIRARGGASGLFSQDKRAHVIHSLYSEATSGNTAAAKIWLTLSGDYSEKDGSTKNEVLDQFREINKIIHGKKS